MVHFGSQECSQWIRLYIQASSRYYPEKHVQFHLYSTFNNCYITTKKLYIDPDVDLDPKPSQKGHKEETFRREPFYRL